MTQSATWRSSRKFPTNALCARAFARELKGELIGTVGTKPEFPQVERAFLERTGAELGKATWNEWWHGRRIPNATYRALIDNAFDGLASKWLYRSLDDRLQCHLSALDLAWIAEHESLEDAESEAWQFLLTIHHEWAPDFRGEIFLPGAVARAGLGEERRHRRWRTDPRTKIPIGMAKGPVSRLNERVFPETASLHEPLNPASVLVYLLRYAAQSRLPDPGLKETFALDFLTAAAACLCLLQILAPHQPERWGRIGQVVMACVDFFWAPDYGCEDPLWFLNEPFMNRIWALLEEIGAAELDHGETRALFVELKASYYSSLGCTGLDADTLLSYASGWLCTRPWVEWR